jgi:protein involved in polysaccharide export with SLBB domain
LIKERAIGATQNYESLQLFITNARKMSSLGRMVIALPELINGSVRDIKLKHGDSLNIPTQPEEVTVIGEVHYSTSHLFNSAFDLEEYISRSGGTKKNANHEMIYVIKANGAVVTANNEKNSFFRRSNDQTMISAGDTIVVPIDTEVASAMEIWSSATQITSQLAITLASFKTLGIF